MRTTAALLVTLALTLPAVAMRPSDMQRQMLAGAQGKYDLELRRTTEEQARCERLVRGESPGVTPGPTPAVPAPAAAAVLVAPAVETARAPVAPAPAAARTPTARATASA